MGDSVNKEDEEATRLAAEKAVRGNKYRGSAPKPSGPTSGSTTDLSTLVDSDKQPQQITGVTEKEAMYQQALIDLADEMYASDKASLLKKLNDPTVTPEEYEEIIDQILNCPF